MTHRTPLAGGFWTFLPYVLAVIGAGIGVFYANAAGGNRNPLIWLAIGLVAGRVVALAIVRLADRFRLRR